MGPANVWLIEICAEVAGPVDVFRVLGLGVWESVSGRVWGIWREYMRGNGCELVLYDRAERDTRKFVSGSGGGEKAARTGLT